MSPRFAGAILLLAACSPSPAASPNPRPSATASSAAPSASTMAPATPLTQEQKAERWLGALEGLAAAAKQDGCSKPNGAVAAYRSAHAAELVVDDATSAYVDETSTLRDRARVAMDAYVTALTGPCH